MLPGSDRNSADWTQWNKKTEAAILCRSYTVLLNVGLPFFFTPEASSCMGAWWSPYMVATAESSTLTSMAITPPESATTSYNANIQQSRATQLPVHFSRKCFPGAQGFDAEPLRAICGNCANLSPANANKDSQRTIHEGLRRDWINQATWDKH